MPVSLHEMNFLQLIRKSGLLNEEAIQRFELTTSVTLSDAVAVANELVRQELITPFHSKVLLSGKQPSFILGPYRILTPLGKGGMGRIYLAEHVTLQRRVAIKVLPSEKARNEEVLQRFYREARSAAALDHPNIVKLYDICQTGSTHYLVMEYVTGKTLQRIVASKGAIPYQQAVSFILQTAAGLKHAHERGFIHRDIKPDNIILSKERVIKILDMGLARSLHQAQDNVTKMMNPKAIYGSVDYISPEQSLGGNVDARSDIYSLGATLFAILSGTAPYSGTAAQVLMSHQFDPIPQLPPLPHQVPAELNSIIAKMMAKKPEARYRSAGELIETLQPWLAAVSGSLRQQNTTMNAASRPTVKVEVKPLTTVAETQGTQEQERPRPLKRKNKPKPGFTISSKMALSLVAGALGIALISFFLIMKSSSNPASIVYIPANTTVATLPSQDARQDVVESKCMTLDLTSIANVISTKNLFNAQEMNGYTDSITLPSWGRNKYHDVPFDLINPQGKAVPNVLVFQGGDTALTKSRPASMVIPCHSAAKMIHFLGGISGWAYPHNSQRTVALIAKLRYQSGKREEHQLINGTHFADWRMPQTLLPTAPIVVQIDKERHLRYFAIKPNLSEEIAEIQLEKGENQAAAPIFFAITVEKP